MPIEFLAMFRVGSFPGMSGESRSYAYAQSWAFVWFLMERHREPFLAFLGRVARQQPEPGEDTLNWLLTSIGTDIRSLDADFQAYVSTLSREDPFWLKELQIIFDLRAELLHLLHRL